MWGEEEAAEGMGQKGEMGGVVAFSNYLMERLNRDLAAVEVEAGCMEEMEVMVDPGPQRQTSAIPYQGWDMGPADVETMQQIQSITQAWVVVAVAV